jgi:hypothetical protein
MLRLAPVALLLVGILLVVAYKLRVRARKSYGQEELISRFSAAPSAWMEAVKMVSWCVVAALLIAVAAGPVRTNHESKIPIGSLQVVAVIDVSPSMAAEDYRDDMPAVNGVPPQEVLGAYGRRIDMVRMAMQKQIMPAIQGNQLGIVLYGGSGKSQVELDDDLNKPNWEFNIGWIEINQAPGDGSDYVSGLKSALTVFSNTPGPKRDKVIVLFSDGGLDGDAKDVKDLSAVAQKINTLGIKVIVVGVGTENEMPIRVYNDNGTFKENLKLPNCDDKDADGACQTKLNMTNLRDLAGRFSAEPLLLKPGEKLPINWASKMAGTKVVHEQEHIFHLFLLPCIALVLLIELRGMRLGAYRRRRSR